MLFTARAAAVLAFVSGVIAQTANFDVVSKPSNWESIPAGKPYTIQWAPTEAYNGQTVTISLIGGAEQNLQVPIKDIQTGVQSSAGTFTWTVDATLGDANVYGLVVKLESNPGVFQYSFPFKISKSTEEAPATAPAPVKTISLSEAPKPTVAPIAPVVPVVTVPCNTTIPVATKINTIVVPCNGTCPHPTGKPIVPVGPVPVVPTPISTPPVAAGAGRIGASIAVVGGLVMAALAL